MPKDRGGWRIVRVGRTRVLAKRPRPSRWESKSCDYSAGRCAQIGRAVGVSAATAGRILRRAGLARRGPLEAPPVMQRYEHPSPGDLLHLDTKKLGRIAGVGHRFTGRAGNVNVHHGIGWEYLHIAVDDHSRVAYVELLADECGVTAAGFLRRASRWFRSHGVRIRRVLTDNGSGYISRSFRATCRGLHLAHRRTRPYTPRTNGKAERFIQTALREWAYLRPYYTSAERASCLTGWIEHYNCARPHGSLAAQPPMSRFPGGNNLMLFTASYPENEDRRRNSGYEPPDHAPKIAGPAKLRDAATIASLKAPTLILDAVKCAL